MNKKNIFSVLGYYQIVAVLLFAGCNRISNQSLIYSTLSDSLLLQGNLAVADSVIQKAIELDSNNFIAYNNLGMLNKKRGLSKDLVLPPLLKAVSIKEDYLTGIFNVAVYYYEIKDYPNSIIYSTKYTDCRKEHFTISRCCTYV